MTFHSWQASWRFYRLGLFVTCESRAFGLAVTWPVGSAFAPLLGRRGLTEHVALLALFFSSPLLGHLHSVSVSDGCLGLLSSGLLFSGYVLLPCCISAFFPLLACLMGARRGFHGRRRLSLLAAGELTEPFA